MRRTTTASIQTERGERLDLRPLRAEDADILIELFEHMSPESRYWRFNQILNDPDPELVQQRAREMADLPESAGAAWLAYSQVTEGQVAVGGVRFMFTEPGEAEIAVAVRDDHQRQGIGSALVAYALQRAYALGIRRITAVVQAGNPAIRALLGRLDLPVTRTYEGPYLHVTIDLTTLPELMSKSLG